MKKISLFALLIATGLMACSNKEPEQSNSLTLGSIVKSTNSIQHLNDATKKAETTRENLKKLTPVSLEQLKAVIPESFGSIPKTSFVVGKSLDTMTLASEYSDNKTKFEINVFDGAGELGSNVAAMFLLEMAMSSEQQSDMGYRKPTVINKIAGIEIQSGKDTQQVKNLIKLIIGNRFFIEVSAKGADMDRLKQAIIESRLIEKLEALK